MLGGASMLIMLTLLQIIAFACPKQALQGVNHRAPLQAHPQGHAKTARAPPMATHGRWATPPKHAARKLIRHSDRRTMRTTRLPICTPGEFLKSAMRRTLQLAYTYRIIPARRLPPGA